MFTRSALLPWPALILLLATGKALSANESTAAIDMENGPSEFRASEPRRWSVHFDNDLLAFTDEDRDYTAGVAFTLEGERAKDHAVSLSGALRWIDGKTRFRSLLGEGAEDAHALEIGLLLFTPHDLGASRPLYDDRPYANLAYVGSSRLALGDSNSTAYQSSLIVGLLGLPFMEQIHRNVHDIVGAEEPLGYDYQISDGGEPTFRYTVSQYRLLGAASYAGRPYALRLGLEASVGYLTEGSVELGVRWGSANTPWWSSFSQSADYAGHPAVTRLRRPAGAGTMALQFSAGVKLRARLYNSFLQGQVRDSDVAYSSSQLNHLLLEAWVGVTGLLENNLSISYTIRHQTEELETGRGARGFTWASLSIAQRF